MREGHNSPGPVLQPVFLKSMLEICACMGVGKETVQQWIDKGAPISVEYKGKQKQYSAEAVSLQYWRNQNFRKE